MAYPPISMNLCHLTASPAEETSPLARLPGLFILPWTITASPTYWAAADVSMVISSTARVDVAIEMIARNERRIGFVGECGMRN